MKALPILLLSMLLPCSALGEQVRIVRCTDGTAAVQEKYTAPGCGGNPLHLVHCPNGHTVWRTLPAGFIPLSAAELLHDEEIAWRNRPPAPVVIQPEQVIK